MGDVGGECVDGIGGECVGGLGKGWKCGLWSV